MNFRIYLFLFFLGLAVPVFIAQYQPIPGYLDADYYFAGGIQLATGEGFTEPYLWNYLDGTTSLPHPSHSYWMPLSSIVAALGMWLTGQTTYAAGRLFFLLIAALVPPITAALAYTFSKRRDLAITSGILAVCCVYNAPFVGVTDNFGLFMLLGGLYFLVATRLIEDPTRAPNWFLLGLLAGLMNLSRTDGLLWLGITFLFALLRVIPVVNHESRTLVPHTHLPDLPGRSQAAPGNAGVVQPATLREPQGISFNLQLAARYALIALLGFLAIMAPWYIRNFNIYGTLMSPGGSRALWLGEYDQTFSYPPSALNMNSFLDLGWKKIILDRISAFGTNLLSGFAAHGEIILFPFIIAGIIFYRKDERVKLAGIAWLILFFVMSFLFPFAGKRGAFFHAGAALQPMWWSLAPLGLESLLGSFRKNGFGSEKSRFIFRSAMIMTTAMLTVYVVDYRFSVMGWGEGEDKYPAVEKFLVENGIKPDDIVIVGNAPGYYITTGRPAISIPYGGEKAIRAASSQFKAYYIVFENKNSSSNPNTKYDQFIYLGDVNDTHIYKIEP